MSNTQEDIARRAAQQLSGEFGQRLPGRVETQLRDASAAPQQFDVGPIIIATATLILNVVKFAWDVYRDRKKDAKPVDANSIARTIRLELKTDSGLSDEQRDKVIRAVVEELLKTPPSS